MLVQKRSEIHCSNMFVTLLFCHTSCSWLCGTVPALAVPVQEQTNHDGGGLLVCFSSGASVAFVSVFIFVYVQVIYKAMVVLTDSFENQHAGCTCSYTCRFRVGVIACVCRWSTCVITADLVLTTLHRILFGSCMNEIAMAWLCFWFENVRGKLDGVVVCGMIGRMPSVAQPERRTEALLLTVMLSMLMLFFVCLHLGRQVVMRLRSSTRLYTGQCWHHCCPISFV